MEVLTTRSAKLVGYWRIHNQQLTFISTSVLYFVSHRYHRVDVVDWLEHVLIDLRDWVTITDTELPKPGGVRPE